MRLHKNRTESAKVLGFLGFRDYDEFSDYLSELLGKVSISEELVKRNVEILFENKAKLKNYPYNVTKKQLEELL